MILIFLSTAITFGSGVIMEAVREKNGDLVQKNFWLCSCLVVSCIFNLLVLFYFKYFEFAIRNINRVIGMGGGKNSGFYGIKLYFPWGFLFILFRL